MPTKFPCVGCGACCMNVGHIPDLKEYALPDGRCSKLDGKTCTIYEDRPLICRVDELGSTLRLSPEMWYTLNLEGCVMLHQQVYGKPLEAEGECECELAGGTGIEPVSVGSKPTGSP